MTHATTWMALDTLMLGERSQPEKAMSHDRKCPEQANPWGRCRLVVARVWNWGNGEWLLRGYRVSFWGNKHVQSLMEGAGQTPCSDHVNALIATGLFTLKWLVLCCVNFTSIFFFKCVCIGICGASGRELRGATWLLALGG